MRSAGRLRVFLVAAALLAAFVWWSYAPQPRALYDAVADGDLAKVRRLAERGAALNWAPESGYGALHKSLSDGRDDIASYLIDMGADVNARGVYGVTPLHVVAGPSLALKLLENGADIEAWSDTLGTPLNAAVLDGMIEVAAVLIARGARLDARDVHLSTPLHHAAGRGDVAFVRRLLAAGADPNAVNAPGFTPLHWAAGNGHEEVVALLLDGGANAQVRSREGRTPLDMAKAGGYANVAGLLDR